MKKKTGFLLSILVFICIASFCNPELTFGSIWYMREDGSATTVYAKDNGDPDNATRCINVAAFVGGSSTFSDGDIVYGSSVGGNITTTVVLPNPIGGGSVLFESAPNDYLNIVVTSGPGVSTSRDGWTISRMSVQGEDRSVYFLGSNETIILNDVVMTGSEDYGYYSATDSTLIMNNCEIYNIMSGIGTGIYLGSTSTSTITDTYIHDNKLGIRTAITAEATFLRCRMSSHVSHGYLGTDSSIVLFINSEADLNLEDGFSNKDSAVMTLINSRASYSGSPLVSPSSGDGFTSHDNAEMNLINCIGNRNKKSGVAVTGSSSGIIYNNTFYDNWDVDGVPSWSTEKGMGIAINSDGNWDIKNNICSNNGAEIVFTALATGTIGSNNNILNNSRESIYGYQWAGVEYATLALYQAASSLDAASIDSDPRFKNVSRNDFTLLLTSPAINLAVELPGYETRLSPISLWPDRVYTVSDTTTAGAYGIIKGTRIQTN